MHPQAEHDRALRERLRRDFNPAEPTDTCTPADEILRHAADLIAQRGAQRDTPSGERSMAAAVEIFRSMTGIELIELDGWLFMVALKLARRKCNRGPVNDDDYLDAIAYLALALEHLHSSE